MNDQNVSNVSWPEVVADLAEQLKQLTLNNTFLRVMLKRTNVEIEELKSKIEELNSKPQGE